MPATYNTPIAFLKLTTCKYSGKYALDGKGSLKIHHWGMSLCGKGLRSAISAFGQIMVPIALSDLQQI